jgi:aryl-alcohol dehydrogenase-like predicted oxidoreductase
MLNPAVVAPLVGARTLAQLDDNLGVFDVTLDPAQQARLAQASEVDLGFPHETLRRLGYSGVRRPP